MRAHAWWSYLRVGWERLEININVLTGLGCKSCRHHVAMGREKE